MKKIGLLSLIALFILTGCGSSKNELRCKGNYLISYNVMLSTTTSGDEKIVSLSFGTDAGYGYGDYTFVFDDDMKKIVSVKGKETMSEELSADVTDEDIEKVNSEGELKAYKDGKRVVLEFNYDDNTMIDAFNDKISSKDDLKKLLEDNTSLICK